jgi:hypothetical protein
MNFGADRKGNVGKGRPVLVIRRWGDEWISLPASLREPAAFARTTKFEVRPNDYAFWSDVGSPPNEWVYYIYERLDLAWLERHRGTLTSVCMDAIRNWLADRYAMDEFGRKTVLGPR